jgi:hypothetical protein
LNTTGKVVAVIDDNGNILITGDAKKMENTK